MMRVVRPLSRAAFRALTRGLARASLTPEQKERFRAFDKRLRTEGVTVVDPATGETDRIVMQPRVEKDD